MIKHFSIIYAGHIDMENMGNNGTVSPILCTPKEVMKEQLTRFAEEVMPAFKNRDAKPGKQSGTIAPAARGSY